MTEEKQLKEAYYLVLRNFKKLTYHERQWFLYHLDEMGESLDYNIVVCGGCNELLESTYGHDYVTCKCPYNTMVDGGREPGGGRYAPTPDTKHFRKREDALAYQKSRMKS